MNKCFELSSKKYKNGRRKFTAVLYKLQPPESVIDGVGTQYNNCLLYTSDAADEL